jgi:photosystem II stability/assembly factor-like uncharacterized protein
MMSYLISHGAGRALRVALLTMVFAGFIPEVAQCASQDLLNTPAGHDLRAEHAVLIAISRAGDRLVAVGERGIVLLSDDNGVTWRQGRSVPSSVALTAVTFVDADNGWAVGHGGVVLHTRDGGETWVKQLDGNLAAQLELQSAQAMAERDPQGSQRRLAAAQQLVADAADKPFLAVYFSSPEKGLVVGAYGLAMLTEDAGAHWHSIGADLENPGGMHLYSILGDRETLLIAGEQGMLLRGSALGRPFTKVKSPYHGTWFGAVSAQPGRELVFGLKGNAYGLDDGNQWAVADTGERTTLTAGKKLADGSILLASEGGRLLRSNDQGRHFEIVSAKELDGSAITDVIQATDGSVVVTSIRGVKRLSPTAIGREITQ